MIVKDRGPRMSREVVRVMSVKEEETSLRGRVSVRVESECGGKVEG